MYIADLFVPRYTGCTRRWTIRSWRALSRTHWHCEGAIAKARQFAASNRNLLRNQTHFMKRAVLIALILGLWLSGEALAQAGISPVRADVSLTADGQRVSTLLPSDDRSFFAGNTDPRLTLPIMSGEVAMATFQRRSASQSAELASYSAISVIRAELPDTSQHGEYEVQRTFTAPRTLLFKPLRFVGDKFVKLVIARLLQSEVDHVEKDEVAQTAITPANYKLSYKGKIDLEGHLVHVFYVKPYKKRSGLFKGHIYLEARTGNLLRAEGRIVKSPSLFVKHIEFAQDYEDIGSFTLLVHVHSEARVFFVGRTIIDITHANYQPVPAEMQAISAQ